MSGKVNVLLATYNGSRFLREQLQSIESQTLPDLFVTIRDDGSTDGTLSILEKWSSRRPHAQLLRGPRLGAAKNFLELLSNFKGDSDYAAFADQDDVWLPEKLERATAAIRDRDPSRPVMYFSRVEYVDEKLEHLGFSRIPKRPSFANALVENIATGCTVVLNRKAVELICTKLPEESPYHDWWCYLVISAFGDVIYDDRPSLLYRQHRDNIAGGTSEILNLCKRRFARLLKHSYKAKVFTDQAAEFNQIFGKDLEPQYRKVLEGFLTVRGGVLSRLAYSGRMEVWRQLWVDSFMLRILILMGRV